MDAICPVLGLAGPILGTLHDKIPILRVFVTRVRDGRASRSGKPVRAGTVASELQAVGKGFTDMGIQDPRLMARFNGDNNF